MILTGKVRYKGEEYSVVTDLNCGQLFTTLNKVRIYGISLDDIKNKLKFIIDNKESNMANSNVTTVVTGHDGPIHVVPNICKRSNREFAAAFYEGSSFVVRADSNHGLILGELLADTVDLAELRNKFNLYTVAVNPEDYPTWANLAPKVISPQQKAEQEKAQKENEQALKEHYEKESANTTKEDDMSEENTTEDTKNKEGGARIGSLAELSYDEVIALKLWRQDKVSDDFFIDCQTRQGFKVVLENKVMMKEGIIYKLDEEGGAEDDFSEYEKKAKAHNPDQEQEWYENKWTQLGAAFVGGVAVGYAVG